MNNCKETINVERLLNKYERVVRNICLGYEDSIYEYKNDLCCRQKLQNVLENGKDVEYQLIARIERADDELKRVLLKTKECIHGNYPEKYFWLWGVPSNVEDMVILAKSNDWL